MNKVDADGATALHHAAYRGSINSVKILVENGSIVDALDSDGCLIPPADLFLSLSPYVFSVQPFTTNSVSCAGVTPLLHSAFMGKAEVLKYLISKNANVNHRDYDGGMALQNACYNGHIGSVQVPTTITFCHFVGTVKPLTSS